MLLDLPHLDKFIFPKDVFMLFPWQNLQIHVNLVHLSADITELESSLAVYRLGYL